VENVTTVRRFVGKLSGYFLGFLYAVDELQRPSAMVLTDVSEH